jgi:integrase
VTTLLYSGIRPGEALALHWDAIDWDHGLILVRWTESRRYGRGLPKTVGSERDVEMIAPVRSALRDQRARSQLKGDLVFPSETGTAIDLANFRARNWTRILTRAKVRPRTIYQCRHTFARLAIEQGDTPQHVAAQLGHTSVEMVFRVYSRWMTRPASRLEALEKAITHPSPKTGGETAASHGN